MAETIASVLGQKLINWELLIVDDSSTDNSWAIIQKYARPDARIRSFRNDTNRGLTRNWRFLIDNAQGEYIAFLEGDDVFKPDNLEQKINIFDRYRDVAMVYSNFSVINSRGAVLTADIYNKYRIKTYKNSCIRATDYLYAKHLPFFSYSQIMIRRTVVDRVGYPRNLNSQSKVFIPSDWDFNFRIATSNKIYYVDRTLLQLRKHANNSSANTIETTGQMRLILDEYANEFRSNDEVLKAINYMRGKLHYYNVIYYLERGDRRNAWVELRSYARKSGLNLWRDWPLNLAITIRIFLPARVNAYLKNRW